MKFVHSVIVPKMPLILWIAWSTEYNSDKAIDKRVAWFPLLIKFEYVFKISNKEEVKTKEIGDFGEGLILGHEKMRVKNGGQEKLIHLIQKIPTQFAVGYDIQSVELNKTKRYIEVKTTVSSKRINYFNFHLTPNEWDVATTLQDNYFVYRLSITKGGTELRMLKNPVSLYKQDKITMSPRDGADIKFSDDVSETTELLLWKD